MSTGLDIEKNQNLAIIDLPDPKKIGKLVDKIAITSGFGCVNPECAIKPNSPRIDAVKRHYLHMRITYVTEKLIFNEPADTNGNRRTCNVRYDNYYLKFIA